MDSGSKPRPEKDKGSSKNYTPEPDTSYTGKENEPSSKDKYKKSYDEFGNKIKDTFKNIKESEIYSYAASNREQTITYILLALGIIFLFINEFVGGLIIGGVAGYHFAPQIVYYLKHMSQIFEGQEQMRFIVLTGTLLAILIAAPGLIIGALILAIFKQVFYSSRSSPPRADDAPKSPTKHKGK